MDRLFPWYLTAGRFTWRTVYRWVFCLVFNALWFAALLTPAALMVKWVVER